MRSLVILACLFLLYLPTELLAQEADPNQLQPELPDLYNLSRENIEIVIDSLSSTMPPPAHAIAEVQLYLHAMELNEDELLLLLDSLLDTDALSFYILDQIQHNLRNRSMSSPAEVLLPPDSSLAAVDSAAPASSNISFSSVEIRPGLDYTSFELRMLGQITDWFYFYSWNRIRATYEGKQADNFNIIDLYFRPFGTFYIVQETQFSEGLGAVVRGGAQYLQRFKGGLFLVLSTVNVEDHRDFEILTQLRYFPKFSPKWSGVLFAESLTIYDKTGHVGSAERIRLGAKRGAYQFGGAIDFQQIGKELEQDYIPALFLICTF